MKTLRVSTAVYIVVAVILPLLKMTTRWPESWWMAAFPIYAPVAILAIVSLGTVMFLTWEHWRQDWSE